MKKQLLILLISFLSLNSFAQVVFEKGYIINNKDQKVECLILNIDWKNNPTEFDYKLNENSEPIKGTLGQVKEFGIINAFKYIRRDVKIDRSGTTVDNLSNDKDPKFNDEQLFLKALVEGKANLYEYSDRSIKRYFYNKGDNTIEQLVYKTYLVTDSDVAKNNKFRQQLWMDLQCQNITLSDVEKVEYKKKDLIKFFTKYAECFNDGVVNFAPKEKKDLFNLTLRPRINNSSLTIDNSSSKQRNTDFGSKTGFGFGVEAEYILPFNKNKWSIAIEPTFQNFKAQKTSNVTDVSGGVQNVSVDYSSIEIPLTFRHYFFLNKNSKLFLNASYIIDLSSKSTVEFTRNDGSTFNTLDLKSRNNPALGLGFKQNDKFSVELRYQTTREILGNYVFWNSNYKTVSFIFGYSFF
ncbi:PorT family protein [Flavobacterium sp. K77]|uniref:autotransporter outer membrane beta-barrel domain-containing protein n=1 Tax=Flavobacterium sp. K77 TaxID=2910676 RepID=UPI001F359AED|nr:outer membrane beta-barrel protein [Flavobacterium sp. K77]MCF6141061.1 PorT family protein [Flavobacterium sp. K77]